MAPYPKIMSKDVFALSGESWVPPLGVSTRLLRLVNSFGFIHDQCEVSFKTKKLSHTVSMRPLTSDVSALSQIFIANEFGNLQLDNPRVCLDLGANVGFSSIYFLNRWPNCRVIAIEADPINFPLLVQNLKPYGDRVLPVLGAVADLNGHVFVERSSIGHWASRISTTNNTSQPCVPAFTLKTILSWCPLGNVDFIKMDIEGAETRVIPWMFDHLESFAGAKFAVELHNSEAHYQFRKLVELVDSPVSTFGEYYSITLPSP